MPIVVTGRHRPHQVMLLTFSALVGVGFVAGLRPPGTLDRLVPGWVLWTWYALLLASGLVGLAALAIRDPYRVLVLERAAMAGQVAAPALYGIALAASAQSTAVFAAGFCAAWSAASMWRGWQVHRGLRALRRGGPG